MSAVASLEQFSGSSTPAHISEGEVARGEEEGEITTSAENLGQPTSAAKEKYGRNPFKLPRNADYAKILRQEQQQRKEKFKKMLTYPVHLKTQARKMPLSDVVTTLSDIPALKERPLSPISVVKNDPDFLIALAKGEKLRNMENLSTFVNNKREMFHIQYMIGVKRDAILRLVRKEERGERKLSTSEKWLEDDAIKFSDFLRLNDREAVDAVKQAEMETKIKLEKVAEIKKLNVLIVSNKSKISKLEDLLTEYKLYGKFLTAVAPQEWKVQKLRERRQRELDQRAKAAAQASKEYFDKYVDKSKRIQIALSATSTLQLPTVQGKKLLRVKTREKGSAGSSRADHDTDEHSSSRSSGSALHDMITDLQLSNDLIQYLMEEDDDEKADLYFTETDQLAGIFADLKEQNLILIQKSQETEESLDEVTTALKAIKKKMKTEAKLLRAQVATLEIRLAWERKRGAKFELMARLASFGEFNEEVQEMLLNDLNAKIESVYTSALGPNIANLNALQMMTSIENKLEVLLEALDGLPIEKIEAATRRRERQRRILIREAKLREQEEYMRQRKLRTMEKAPISRRVVTTRKLNPRSTPPAIVKKVVQVQGMTRNEEDILYFFT